MPFISIQSIARRLLTTPPVVTPTSGFVRSLTVEAPAEEYWVAGGASQSISGDSLTMFVHTYSRSGAPFGSVNGILVFRRTTVDSAWTRHSEIVADSGTTSGWGTSIDDWTGSTGIACSTDGNTVVVSDYYENIIGVVAYVYFWNGAAWVQQGQLQLPGQQGGGTETYVDHVAISDDGNTVALTSYLWTQGSTEYEYYYSFYDTYDPYVYVYTRSASTWSLQQKITATSMYVPETYAPLICASISGDGDTVALLSSNDNSQMEVFTRSAGVWSQAYFKKFNVRSRWASTWGGYTPPTISYDGSIICLSDRSWYIPVEYAYSWGTSWDKSGIVEVFEKIGANWESTAIIKPNIPIYYDGGNTNFANGLMINSDGSRLIVYPRLAGRRIAAPPGGHEAQYQSPPMMMYERVAQGNWKLLTEIWPEDWFATGFFHQVTISDDGLSFTMGSDEFKDAISAYNQGRAYVYDFKTLTDYPRLYWEPLPILEEPVQAFSNWYPATIGLSGDGNTLFSGNYSIGDVMYVHTWNGSGWTLQDTLSPPGGALTIGGSGGFATSTDGNTVFAIADGNLAIFYRTGSPGTWSAGETLVPESGHTFSSGMWLSGDGQTFFINAYNGTRYVVDIYRRGGSPTWTFTESITYGTSTVDLDVTSSSDGNTLLFVNRSSTSYNRTQIYEYGGSPAVWSLSRSFSDQFQDEASGTGVPTGSISADGNTAIVLNTDSSFNSHNRIQVFRREADRSINRWTRIGNLVSDSPLSYGHAWGGLQWFGAPNVWCSSDGNLILASLPGGYNTANGNNTGRAYVYRYLPDNDQWRLERTLESIYSHAEEIYHEFGYAQRISEDGSMIVIGAGGYDITAGANGDEGGIYTFTSRIAASAETLRDKPYWQLAISERGYNTGAVGRAALARGGTRMARSRGAYWAEVDNLVNGKIFPFEDLYINDDAFANDTGRYSLSISDDGSRVACDAQIVSGVPYAAGDFAMVSHMQTSILDAQTPTYYFISTPGSTGSPVTHSPRTVYISGDGNTLFVGDYSIVDSLYTRVHVYVWGGSSWTFEATLLPSEGPVRKDFGYSIASTYTGDKVVIGAPNLASAAGVTAAVYVFERTGTVWSETTYVNDPSTSAEVSKFGITVAISSSGARWVTGDPERYPGGPDPVTSQTGPEGTLYIYNSSNTLQYSYAPPITATAASFAGVALAGSVAISGDGTTVVAGAYKYGGMSPAEWYSYVPGGAAYVFVYSTGQWRLEQILSTYSDSSLFGYGVSINSDGSMISVDAPTHYITGDTTYPGPGTTTLFVNADYVAAEEKNLGPIPEITYAYEEPTGWAVPPNSSITARTRLTNTSHFSQETLTNLNVQVVLPTFQYGTVSAPTVSQGSVVGDVWSVGSLAYGASATIEVTGTTGSYSAGTSYPSDIGCIQLGTDVGSDNWQYSLSGYEGIILTNDGIRDPAREVRYLENYLFSRNVITSGSSSGSRNMVATAYGTYGFPTNSATNTHEQLYWSGKTYGHVPPCVSPNGDWVLYGVTTSPYIRQYKRFVVQPRWHKIYNDPFLAPADYPPAAYNWLSISPDSSATYLSYCANAAAGLRLYKRSGELWDLMSTPAVVPDGTPRHTSWDETGTYLAVAASAGSRCWYAWKRTGDTFADISSGFTGPDNGAASRYGRVAEFSPATGDGTFLFVGTNTTYGTPVVYVLDTGTDTFTLAQTLSDLPSTKNIADAAWDTTGTYLAIVYEDTVPTYPYVYKRSGTTFALLSSAFAGSPPATTTTNVCRTVSFSYDTTTLAVGSSQSVNTTAYGRIYRRVGDTFYDGAILGTSPTSGSLQSARSEIWPGPYSGPYITKMDDLPV